MLLLVGDTHLHETFIVYVNINIIAGRYFCFLSDTTICCHSEFSALLAPGTDATYVSFGIGMCSNTILYMSECKRSSHYFQANISSFPNSFGIINNLFAKEQYLNCTCTYILSLEFKIITWLKYILNSRYQKF